MHYTMRSCRQQEDVGLRFRIIVRSMQTDELQGMMDEAPVAGAFQVSDFRSCLVLDFRQASTFKANLFKASISCIT